ncbi:MAG: HAD hydrolase-like protein [Lachnospiraceae bacterium]
MRNAIIFLDSGDTLVDESTEVRIKGDVVDHAEFFPGIKEVLFQLKMRVSGWRWWRTAWVESFDNIYQQHEMETYFEVRAISETIGVCKPAGEMFKTAMEKMNLEEADKSI